MVSRNNLILYCLLFYSVADLIYGSITPLFNITQLGDLSQMPVRSIIYSAKVIKSRLLLRYCNDAAGLGKGTHELYNRRRSSQHTVHSQIAFDYTRVQYLNVYNVTNGS